MKYPRTLSPIENAAIDAQAIKVRYPDDVTPVPVPVMQWPTDFPSKHDGGTQPKGDGGG